MSGLVVPDSTVRRVFFLNNDFESNITSVRVFDQHTFLSVGGFEIPGGSENGSLIGFHGFLRWGENGLAFGQGPDVSGSGGDEVFLIQTPLICLSSTQ